VEPFESEGRPGTIANEPLEPLSVGGLDTDAGVQAESTAMIPAEHILSVVEFQEAVAGKVAEDSLSDGVLEALQESVGEGGGFVEAEAGLWIGRILTGVILDSLEQTVHDAQVEMVVRVQRRAEAMQEADRAHGSGSWSRWAGLPQGGTEGPEQDVENGAGGPGPVVEVRPQTLGNGEHDLTDGHVGEDVIDQMGGCLGHTLGSARGTAPPALA
jgi:hypothetical protein